MGWMSVTAALGAAVAACGASAAQASVASDIIAYVGRDAGSFSCSEGTVQGRQFVHCRSGANCETPNLIFEIRGSFAVWVNGKTGSFVDAHPRHAVRIVDGRPLPYTPIDVMKGMGCP
jgi:hypothetical protein